LSFQNELFGIFVDQVMDIISVYDEKEVFDSDDFISGYGIEYDGRKLSILDMDFIINKT
jgi:chemotaxis signal transduction protein